MKKLMILSLLFGFLSFPFITNAQTSVAKEQLSPNVIAYRLLANFENLPVLDSITRTAIDTETNTKLEDSIEMYGLVDPYFYKYTNFLHARAHYLEERSLSNELSLDREGFKGLSNVFTKISFIHGGFSSLGRLMEFHYHFGRYINTNDGFSEAKGEKKLSDKKWKWFMDFTEKNENDALLMLTMVSAAKAEYLQLLDSQKHISAEDKTAMKDIVERITPHLLTF